ncbi:hypothetical protein Emed_002327 [Eimeria media]
MKARARKCGLKYDEVTYTLKLHGYILCHRQKPEKGIVISQMELQDIFCALPPDAYQNLCKLAFHAAIKVQRQRRMRLRERLLATPPQELFAMTYRDVLAMLDEQEQALCFPDDALSLIDVGEATSAPALEQNAGFLELYNEALGFEDTRDRAGLLEGSQANALMGDFP